MSDTFIITCPYCAGEMQATPDHVDTEVSCPFCQQPFIVGEPEEGDYQDESYEEVSQFDRTATDPLNDTTVYRADETMVLSYSDIHRHDLYNALPEVIVPQPPEEPPPEPADHAALTICLHALQYQWPDYVEAFVKLDRQAAWQYAVVGEIIDQSIKSLIKEASETEVHTATVWLFNQKKTMAHLERFYGNYLKVIGQAQALLALNLPDPPWEHDADFYQEFYDELCRISGEMGQLHTDICTDPLPEKAPFDELQRLAQTWVVDYARNIHGLANRFREKSALPYQETAIGVVQFTLASPTFSRFLSIYQAQPRA